MAARRKPAEDKQHDITKSVIFFLGLTNLFSIGMLVLVLLFTLFFKDRTESVTNIILVVVTALASIATGTVGSLGSMLAHTGRSDVGNVNANITNPPDNPVNVAESE